MSACPQVSLIAVAMFTMRLANIVAEKFEARDVRWAPDGKGLVLVDRDTFCCAFEVEDAEDEQ